MAVGKACGSRLDAVIEPLEVVVGARFGQKPCDNRPVAVTEPLDITVRAQLQQKLNNQEHKCRK